MFKSRLAWVLTFAAAFALTTVAQPGPLSAQDTVEPAATADAQPPMATQPEKKPRAKPRGRLPNYYAKMVDKKQREQIYAIQAQHADAIAKLQAELAKLIAQRDAEVRAVLTPEQQQQVDKLQSEAMAKRKSRSR